MSQSSSDGSHISWEAPRPSAQSSQFIIENGEKTSATSGQGQHPGMSSRRISHNYEQDTARFNAEHSSEGKTDAAPSDGKHHSRQKSFSREDQKRLAHSFMMTDGDKKSFSET
jgi:hypothetical protein